MTLPYYHESMALELAQFSEEFDEWLDCGSLCTSTNCLMATSSRLSKDALQLTDIYVESS